MHKVWKQILGNKLKKFLGPEFERDLRPFQKSLVRFVKLNYKSVYLPKSIFKFQFSLKRAKISKISYYCLFCDFATKWNNIWQWDLAFYDFKLTYTIHTNEPVSEMFCKMWNVELSVPPESRNPQCGIFGPQRNTKRYATQPAAIITPLKPFTLKLLKPSQATRV